jgi:hypothetical protein
MSDQGRGVLLITVDLDPVDRDELVEWFDDEYIPAMLREPGHRGGRRFRADEDPSRYLVIYDWCS